MTVLKWAWRHGATIVSEYDDLESALWGVYRDAVDGKLACLEVTGADGRIIDADEAWKLVGPLSRQEDEHSSETDAVIRFEVRLAAPSHDGDATMSYAATEAEAISKADDLAERYGTGRVSVHHYGVLRPGSLVASR